MRSVSYVWTGVQKVLNLGPPTCGHPGCIMQPEATFVSRVYTVTITQ